MADETLPNATWRKSSYSSANGQCVEVADTPGTSAVRDTQNRHLGTLTFNSTEWHAFLSTVKNSEL